MTATQTGLKLRVRFAETDAMGVAHHSAYVAWLEAARVEWLRERGVLYSDIEASGTNLAVSALSIHYRAGVRFDDEIEIDTTLTEARSRRFRYEYTLIRVSDGSKVAEAETVHTPTDRRGRAVRLAAEWMEKLKTHVRTEEER